MGRRVKSSKTNLPKGKQNNKKQTSRVVSVSRAPVSIAQNSRSGNPVVKQSRNGQCVHVTHREYFMDLVGNKETFIPSTPDQAKFLSCQITPSNAQIFPWLSKMAKLYEQYKFEELHFEYQPYQSTSNQGVVLMAIDYDASDDPPASKTDFLAYDGAARTSVWAPATIRAPKNKMSALPRYYVRGTVFSDTSDATLRQTCVGSFYATSVSCPTGLDGSGLGELYVSYTVTFFTPQLTSTFYDQFTSRSTDNPTGFFLNPPAPYNVFVKSTIPYSIVDANTISINQAYDGLLLIAGKTGVGITNAPSLLHGGDIEVTSTIVDWHDSANSHGVFMAELRVRNPGANLSVNINAYATLSALYFNIIAKPAIALEFGSTLV